MPSMTKIDAAEAKGKAIYLWVMSLFLWLVVGITVWGIGEFIWRMFVSG